MTDIETVWVADQSNRMVYHEDPDCGRLTDGRTHKAVRSSLDVAYRPCPWCTTTPDNPDGRGDWSYQQALADADPGDLA